MIKAMFFFVIILFSSIFAILALYLSAAFWSERQAEKKAHADCALAVPGKPMEQLELQLVQPNGLVNTYAAGGRTTVMSTHKSTIVVSSYTCIVDIVNNLVKSSEVVYKD
jgi:hypothetical protein